MLLQGGIRVCSAEKRECLVGEGDVLARGVGVGSLHKVGNDGIGEERAGRLVENGADERCNDGIREPVGEHAEPAEPQHVGVVVADEPYHQVLHVCRQNGIDRVDVVMDVVVGIAVHDHARLGVSQIGNLFVELVLLVEERIELVVERRTACVKAEIGNGDLHLPPLHDDGHKGHLTDTKGGDEHGIKVTGHREGAVSNLARIENVPIPVWLDSFQADGAPFDVRRIGYSLDATGILA